MTARRHGVIAGPRAMNERDDAHSDNDGFNKPQTGG
jgi:hypothetical protein